MAHKRKIQSVLAISFVFIFTFSFVYFSYDYIESESNKAQILVGDVSNAARAVNCVNFGDTQVFSITGLKVNDSTIALNNSDTAAVDLLVSACTGTAITSGATNASGSITLCAKIKAASTSQKTSFTVTATDHATTPVTKTKFFTIGRKCISSLKPANGTTVITAISPTISLGESYVLPLNAEVIYSNATNPSEKINPLLSTSTVYNLNITDVAGSTNVGTVDAQGFTPNAVGTYIIQLESTAAENNPLWANPYLSPDTITLTVNKWSNNPSVFISKGSVAAE